MLPRLHDSLVREFEKMTYPEVSEILNIPLNTVKTRIFYAKEALRESMERMGVAKNDL
jgi:RNA polymerase sigma-70 factor (ECF subfamily)